MARNEENPELRARLRERMLISAESKVLDPMAMDLDIMNPEAVDARMGRALQLSGLVESQVAKDVAVIEGLLPHLDPERAWYVNEVWMPQELAHGDATDIVLGKLERPPIPVETDVAQKIRVVGAINTMAPPLHRVFDMVFNATGAATERTAGLFYSRMIKIARDLGEKGLAETLLAPVIRQEPQHMHVYRAGGEMVWDTMSQPERWLAQQIFMRTYSPPGTTSRPEMTRPHYAEVAVMLAASDAVHPDGRIDTFTEPVVNEEVNILHADKDAGMLSEAVRQAFRKPIEEALSRGDLDKEATKAYQEALL